MLTNRDSTSQMGFFGRKTISYRKVKLNAPIRKEIVKLENNVIVNDDALGKQASYWDEARHLSFLSVNREFILWLTPFRMCLCTRISSILSKLL